MSDPTAAETAVATLPLGAHKLYVIGRRDLAPGLRAAQIAHAVAEVILDYPTQADLWNTTDNYLIVLEVDGEEDLNWMAVMMDAIGIPTTVFREPDLDHQMTAVACLPNPRDNHAFSGMRLAYRETWLDRLIRWTGAR